LGTCFGALQTIQRQRAGINVKEILHHNPIKANASSAPSEDYSGNSAIAKGNHAMFRGHTRLATENKLPWILRSETRVSTQAQAPPRKLLAFN
jgi:hypothetical protein